MYTAVEFFALFTVLLFILSVIGFAYSGVRKLYRKKIEISIMISTIMLVFSAILFILFAIFSQVNLKA